LGDLDAFALDSSMVRLPAWQSSNPGVCVHDAQYRVLFEVDPDRRRVTLLAPGGHLAVRSALMRVVRELVMNQLRWQGEVLLHAAALEEGGGAILISAERGGGKTTLLTYLLRHLGARYIANDRVWLRAIAGAPVARGMPSVVTLRRPTLEMFPSLERGLESSGWSMRSRLDEEQAKPSALERRWKGGRYGITPAQYCRLVGASSIAEAPLRLAVFP
jgi:hypothetical protein